MKAIVTCCQGEWYLECPACHAYVDEGPCHECGTIVEAPNDSDPPPPPVVLAPGGIPDDTYVEGEF